jgi:hypothetical protein
MKYYTIIRPLISGGLIIMLLITIMVQDIICVVSCLFVMRSLSFVGGN